MLPSLNSRGLLRAVIVLHSTSSPPCITMDDGIGVAKGLAAARIWFEKSSDQGNVDGQTQFRIIMAIGAAIEYQKELPW